MLIGFHIVEKKNPNAVHAHCATRESAQRWLDNNAKEYCAKGYFMDKTLVHTDFEIKEIKEFK